MFQACVWSLLLGMFVTLAPSAPIPRERQKEVPFFPVTLGTKWVYDDGSREITQIITASKSKGDETWLTVSEGMKKGELVPVEELIVSPKGLFLRENVGQAFDPPLLLVKYPSSPGDRWESKGLCLKQPYEDAALLRDTLEVEVPAGKFTTFPVDRTGTFLNLTAKTTMWYARGVGLVRRLDVAGLNSRVETMLKSFTPGKE